jgi:paired amphipathic helix protein Sin3a
VWLVHTFAVVAVPVILKRLKQKDNEWRNARREWNKIWREVLLALFGS